MAGDSSGNRRRMKIEADASGSRRTRVQFILSQRPGSGSLSHPRGTGLELGEGSGRAGDEWEELASEIAHLQIIDFCCTQALHLCQPAHSGGGSGRWMTQIGIFSRGQLRGRKGPGQECPPTQPATACHRLHSPDLESLLFCQWCLVGTCMVGSKFEVAMVSRGLRQ